MERTMQMTITFLFVLAVSVSVLAMAVFVYLIYRHAKTAQCTATRALIKASECSGALRSVCDEQVRHIKDISDLQSRPIR
jgi:hypothetical protein